MGKIKQFIKRRGIFVIMLLAGLYYGAIALWGLTNTLLYYHEAVVLPGTVIDVRQRPFESYSEALKYGNLPWDGDISYRPILTFVMPARIPIRAYTSPDLDNADYQRGEQVEIITHPHDPNQAHVKKWKFLWGADFMLLTFAALIGVPSWFVLFPRKRRAAARKSAPRPAQPKAQQKAPAKAQPQPRRAPEPEQPTFTLEPMPAPAPAKKPRAPRKKKEVDPDAPQKPRAPRKKKEVDPNAPPKPRKPRKKKTEA